MKESEEMKVKVLKPVFAEVANQLVHSAGKFQETILIKKDHWVVDAKSMLGLLAISLQPGQEVEISVPVGDTEQVINELIETGIFERAS